jgi:hypothetical protein
MTDDVIQMDWAKFYWSDWEGDDDLALCSLAAQGLWLRLLCMMAKAKPVGHLTRAKGQMTVRDIAFLVRQDEATITALLDELERENVFSRTDDGTIYSRRMIRDYAKYLTDIENGKRGGRPLKQQLNQPNNPPVKPPGYKNQKGEGKTPRLVKNKTGGHNHSDTDTEADTEAETEASAYVSAVEYPDQAARKPPDARRSASAGAYAAGRAGGSRAAAPAPPGRKYPKPNPDPTFIPSGKYDWKFALQICREDRIWDDSLGPPPGDPHCYVPPELLQPRDGEGWADMTPKPEDKRRRQ